MGKRMGAAWLLNQGNAGFRQEPEAPVLFTFLPGSSDTRDPRLSLRRACKSQSSSLALTFQPSCSLQGGR